MASPWYDIAVLIEGDRLQETDIKTLLQHYLQRDASTMELSTLLTYRSIYCYLETLWHLALDRPGQSDAVSLQRIADLEELLSDREIER